MKHQNDLDLKVTDKRPKIYLHINADKKGLTNMKNKYIVVIINMTKSM